MDKDSAWGEIKDNEMEYCWTAFNRVLSGRNAASEVDPDFGTGSLIGARSALSWGMRRPTYRFPTIAASFF